MPGGTVEKRPDHLPVAVPGIPVRRRESEALPFRLARSARRNRHVTVPLAVPLVTWTAAEIMHAYGMGDDALLAGAVATLAVLFFAPHKWDRPGEQWYARLSAAALWLWLWAAATFGADAGTPGEVLGALLAVLSVAWGIPWYMHKRPRGMKDREKVAREWESWWAYWSTQWNLGGSRVIDAADDGVTVTLRVQLWGGRQTEDDVQACVRRMRSALGDFAGRGGVSVAAVDGNPSQVDLRIARANPLAEPVEWDEALAPRSVLDPWYPAKSETGRRRPVRQLGSMFTLGMKGTGKSTLLLTRILSLCGTVDAFEILIDLKGGRSARPVLEAGAADWVITDQREAELAYMMAEAEILARAEGAYDGSEQLTPTPSTPAIFLHVDEVHRFASVNRGTKQAADSMEVVATTGRSSQVHEDVVTQYGALDASVRYEGTRMNLDLRFVYRMPRADMASFAINEWSRLDVSKLGTGECYAAEVRADGTPATDPERLRGVLISHDAFRELAPARVAKRGPRPRLILWCGNQPCPAGGTWQQFADSRWGRLPKAFREISPQYQEWAREHGEPEDDAPAAASVPQHAAPAPVPAAAPASAPSGAEVAAMIAEETSGPDLAPTAEARAMAAGSGAARLKAFCDTLAAGPASPDALVKASGLPRSTVMDRLRRLKDRGAVTQPDKGVYVVARGRDVHAELGAVKAGDGALEAGARDRLHLVQSAS